MKSKLLVHAASIVFVTAILLAVLAAFDGKTQKGAAASTGAHETPDLSFVDFSNPFQRALTLDAMNIFFPGRFDANTAVVSAAANVQDRALRERLQESGVAQRLSWERLRQIFGMFVKFLIVYGIVMLLTYYGVQTIGVWRFCQKKTRKSDTNRKWAVGALIIRGLKGAVLGVASFILFCPAYVIAYSVRTELNTDTVFFMVVLCVISNGLLMVYSNKFYAFLVTEGRKGYVDTAIVKNLSNSYDRAGADGIPLKALLSPRKRFSGHVFDHIFRNARFQYLSTIKEQASFLITGMIITEMALNLHGYFSYELLRQMLYGNIDIVIVMLLGIFYTVKATEIGTDYIVYKEEKRYEN
jgi:hypothetical protein